MMKIYLQNLININANYILIPPGLKPYVQPLDVSINEPFKKYLHRWYIDFIIDNENQRRPTDRDIIDAVVDIWYDNLKISTESIIKSFIVTGISAKLDGSEDNLIIHHPEFWDEIVSPSEININDEEFNSILEKVEIEKKDKNTKTNNIQTKLINFFVKDDSESMDLED